VRAWWYSELRRKIASGLMDIDIEDSKLQEELLGIQTKFPAAGVQRMLIESKIDMRKRGVGSPDYADAAMYSQIDYMHPHNNPLLAIPVGQYRIDPEYAPHANTERIGGYGAPI
jgi:hypothetical protein